MSDTPTNFDHALDALTISHLKDPASPVHTVYEGIKKTNGQSTGKRAIVCVVGPIATNPLDRENTELVKLTASELHALHIPIIPSEVFGVPTDVVLAEPPRDMRLRYSEQETYSVSQAARDHQRCFDGPVPGGIQIAPNDPNAGWLGTGGAPFSWIDEDGNEAFGLLTNRHVGVVGNGQRGSKIGQPNPNPDFIGRLDKWGPFNRGSTNYLDVALINCRRDDGRYGENDHGYTDLIASRQLFGIGEMDTNPVEVELEMPATKSGRTTGVTTGRCVGKKARSNINYGDQGTLRFDDLDVYESPSGHFSQPGDSGSLIVHRSTLQPMSLLFAGGGGITLAIRVKRILDWSGGRFF